MSARYKIVGIVAPGRINVKLNGRFTDVELYSASDDVLDKLYAEKCEYIQLMPEEYLKQNPMATDIEVKKIDIKKSATSKKYVDR